MSFSYKGTNPFNEGHTLIAELPPEVPSPQYITFRVGISTQNLGGWGASQVDQW